MAESNHSTPPASPGSEETAQALLGSEESARATLQRIAYAVEAKRRCAVDTSRRGEYPDAVRAVMVFVRQLQCILDLPISDIPPAPAPARKGGR